MKKTALAAAAMLLLCSCSYDDGFPGDGMYIEEETAEVTEAFTLPDDLSELIPDKPTPSVDPELPPAEVPDVTESEEPTTEPTTEEVTEIATLPLNPGLPADEVPKGCINVPYLSQKDYPTGCELVSTSMLLRYYGFDIDAGDLIKDGWIEAQELEADPNDRTKLIGGDPDKVFIGDPYGDTGYGCYSGAILSGLKKYLDGQYFDVVDLKGLPLKDVCMLYLDFRQPVLLWATIEMEPTFIGEENSTWTIKGTNKEFTWLSNEHCMLLVGYDEEYYYFNDPLNGKAVPYERAVVEERFREMGSQAVTIHPW